MFRQKSLRVAGSEESSTDGSIKLKSKELIEGKKKLIEAASKLNKTKPTNQDDDKINFLMDELTGKLGTSKDDVSSCGEDDLSDYDIENVTSEMIRITVEEENKASYER